MAGTVSLPSSNSQILTVFFDNGVLTSCLLKDGTTLKFGNDFIKKHGAIEWSQHEHREFMSGGRGGYEFCRWLRKHRMKKFFAGYGHKRFDKIPLEVLI